MTVYFCGNLQSKVKNSSGDPRRPSNYQMLAALYDLLAASHFLAAAGLQIAAMCIPRDASLPDNEGVYWSLIDMVKEERTLSIHMSAKHQDICKNFMEPSYNSSEYPRSE